MSKAAEHYEIDDEASHGLHLWGCVNVVCSAIINKELHPDDLRRLVDTITTFTPEEEW